MAQPDLKKLVAPQSDGLLTDPISTDMIHQRRQAYHYQWWRPEDTSQNCHTLTAACLCPLHTTIRQRRLALFDDLSRYACCYGACPCSGGCGEQHCPEWCLCCEVTWCFCYAVLATRWLLQDQMHIQERGAGRCLSSCLLCFRSFLQTAKRGAKSAEPGQMSLTRYMRRNHLARVLEGSFFMCVSCPVVCAMYAQWSVQHEAIIALRDKSPHILRPAMHPTEAPERQFMSL